MQQFPAGLMPTVLIAEAMAMAAQEAARAASKKLKQALPRHTRRGETLIPGRDTPLWNELVKATIPLLARRGEKARLGRLLNLPRQRINDFFVARNSVPDGERILLILHWLHVRSQGRELG